MGQALRADRSGSIKRTLAAGVPQRIVVEVEAGIVVGSDDLFAGGLISACGGNGRGDYCCCC